MRFERLHTTNPKANPNPYFFGFYKTINGTTTLTTAPCSHHRFGLHLCISSLPLSTDSGVSICTFFGTSISSTGNQSICARPRWIRPSHEPKLQQVLIFFWRRLALPTAPECRRLGHIRSRVSGCRNPHEYEIRPSLS